MFCSNVRHGAWRQFGILLSVHADDADWARRAETILKQTGADDIASTGETEGDVQNTDRPMLRGNAS